MKVRVSFLLGVLLILFGVTLFVVLPGPGGVIPVGVGAALIFLNWRPGRVGFLIFGHVSIILGCFLITWGIYLLPSSQPTLAHIFCRPLFWGLFSVMGGMCANYHGFCRCIQQKWEPSSRPQ